MKILFRTDAGPQIGAGHAMRCLALAQACRKNRATAVFVMVESLPATTACLRDEGIEMRSLDAMPGSNADAIMTLALAREMDCAWVVIDGYQFGADYQDVITAGDHRLLVIDDHGHSGRYSADLVLDQNLMADAKCYAQHPRATRLLLGSSFALLRDQFSQWRDWRREINPTARRVLVTFGAVDPVGATPRVLQALFAFKDLEIVAVMGSNTGTVLPGLPHVRIERAVTDMPRLMSECDFAITAGGSTCWELAFMQTPMLVMPIATNQRPIAKALGERGVAIDLGWHADVSNEHLDSSVRAFIDDASRRRAMAVAGRALIDGEGATRVVAQMKSVGEPVAGKSF